MAHDHADDRDRHIRVDEPLTVGMPALAKIHVDSGLLEDLVGVHPRGVACKVPVRGDGAEEQRPGGRTYRLDVLRPRHEVAREERVRIRVNGCLPLLSILALALGVQHIDGPCAVVDVDVVHVAEPELLGPQAGADREYDRRIPDHRRPILVVYLLRRLDDEPHFLGSEAGKPLVGGGYLQMRVLGHSGLVCVVADEGEDVGQGGELMDHLRIGDV